MIYQDSVEEQKYLSGLRKEKDAFERLIREKAVSSTTDLVAMTPELNRVASACAEYAYTDQLAPACTS
jgi:hypothetical protein